MSYLIIQEETGDPGQAVRALAPRVCQHVEIENNCLIQ